MRITTGTQQKIIISHQIQTFQTMNVNNVEAFLVLQLEHIAIDSFQKLHLNN